MGHSRFTFREVIADKTTDSLISFLARTFQEMDGVCREIVFDNGVSMVSKPRTKDFEGEIVYKLKQFLDDYGIEPVICMSGRPETKGKVEVQMKILDELKGYGGEIKDLYHLDKILQNITNAQNKRVSQGTNRIPAIDWQKEKEHIYPLPSNKICSKYAMVDNFANVNQESLVSYKSNLYSVPPKYIGIKVNRREINNKLHLYYNEKVIATHNISAQKINYNDHHYKELNKLIYKDNNISENLTKISQRTSQLERIKYD